MARYCCLPRDAVLRSDGGRRNIARESPGTSSPWQPAHPRGPKPLTALTFASVYARFDARAPGVAKERDVGDLLTLYGVGDEERAAMMSLARQANAPEWWQEFADVVPPWFLSYLGLEEAASLIRAYEVHFVPGLLQTRDYARAVIEQGHADASAAEITKRVAVRQGRQKVLTRPNPPQLSAVLDEAVLRRPIGGRDVMREQVQALIEASELPNVRLQIAPFRAGAHAAV